MHAIAQTPALVAPVARVQAKAPRAVRAVAPRRAVAVAKAQKEELPAHLKLAAALTVASVPAAPSMALVDPDLFQDGVGKPLGVDGFGTFAVLFLGFTFIWSQYYAFTQEQGDFSDDDGLSL